MAGTGSVIIVGSGASGLSAALAAVRAGASVTMIERAELCGGTTALSGGIAWLPGRDGDDHDEVRTYLNQLSLGDFDAERADVLVRSAAKVSSALETDTALRWQQLPYPDYHSEFRGGREAGRSVEPQPVVVPPGVVGRVRAAPNVTKPVTYRELASGEIDREAVAARECDGVLTMGRALVAALLEQVLAYGATVVTGERAHSLIVDGYQVTGVRTDGGERYGRVVLATGGFERDPSLVRAFLRGPMIAPAGVPTNTGDGLRMAMSVGAALGNMSEAWWAPAYSVPDERIDGAPMHRVVLTERARPHCLIVDSDGRRFVDEAQNYNDVGRSLHAFDPARFRYPRVPAWLVFDSRYRSSYNLGPLHRRDTVDPDWLACGATVAELAARIDVPPASLTGSVERFNDLAESGVDTDFGRGDFAYDRFMGDGKATHPTLGTVAEPPFYAVRVVPGCLGTKGGAVTDDAGRVLTASRREPIPGVYAAGNASSSPLGAAYPGAGGTLGGGLVFGYTAGESAAYD